MIMLTPSVDALFTSFHVGVAAEATAAALFARCGLDVSVQYGANQPEYDLMVSRGAHLLKVSVKGSKDGGWGLTQSRMEPGKADYHGAIDRWLIRHKARTVLCFVQFQTKVRRARVRHRPEPDIARLLLPEGTNARHGRLARKRATEC